MVAQIARSLVDWQRKLSKIFISSTRPKFFLCFVLIVYFLAVRIQYWLIKECNISERSKYNYQRQLLIVDLLFQLHNAESPRNWK